MQRILYRVFFLFLAIGLVAVLLKEHTPRRPSILCTTAFIAEMAQELAGDYWEIDLLVPRQVNPHTYEFVKGDMERLDHATAIFYHGLGLEHSYGLIKRLTAHPQSINLGQEIEKKYPEEIIYVDNIPDPHLWMNPKLWSNAIGIVCETCIKLDPLNADNYQFKAHAYRQKLLHLDAQITTLFQTLPSESRYLISSHDAFRYFARAYLAEPDEKNSAQWMERCIAPEGFAPESQISPHDLQLVLDHMKRHHLRVLFVESNVNSDSLNRLVEIGKAKGLSPILWKQPLYSDMMGKEGSDGDTYSKMLLYNAQVISTALSTPTHTSHSEGAPLS